MSAPAVAPLQVLYVEDNRVTAMLFEQMLRPYGQLALRLAEDSDDALRLVQDWTPQVLVLDNHLPGISGLDLLGQLRALPALADVPAYMCSADELPQDRQRAMAAGFADYWVKPVSPSQVLDTLLAIAAPRR